jgi:molecular chaperone DnaK (HSP70)
MAGPTVVGIDLGTTNSAVATVDGKRVEILPIDQVVASGESAPRPLLPSALYLPAGSELPPGALKLPWGEPPFVVGAFARHQGARVPGRLVTSAKSWLCHPGVDRTAAILPWGAADDVARVSPVEASARLLAHLRSAWEHHHPGQKLSDQEVVLTVPASFDEVARELTVESARVAGLEHVTLLEEPLAAFYHWLETQRGAQDKALAGISLILVVDIGGGTTDLTLIQATAADDGLRLDRIAVGDHLLLGGDNVDLAIARLAEQRLGGASLDATEWGALVLAARGAKEALLADDAPESRSLAVLGRSSRLLGGSKRVDVTRDEVRALVLDGFLPQVPLSARPDRRAGLKQLGLPYASDAGITKHIAAFLGRHLLVEQRVDAVLFNGGALTPRLVQERLLDVLESWGGRRPVLLVNDALDLAVARGAAYFGLVRRGEGVRVGGGSPRAYFLGVRTEKGHEAVCSPAVTWCSRRGGRCGSSSYRRRPGRPRGLVTSPPWKARRILSACRQFRRWCARAEKPVSGLFRSSRASPRLAHWRCSASPARSASSWSSSSAARRLMAACSRPWRCRAASRTPASWWRSSTGRSRPPTWTRAR